MKVIPSPFLRALLLLTLAVGMLGHAKLLMLHKIGADKERLASILQESSTRPLQTNSIEETPVGYSTESVAVTLTKSTRIKSEEPSAVSLQPPSAVSLKPPPAVSITKLETLFLSESSADIIKNLEAKMTTPVVIPEQRNIESINSSRQFFSPKELAYQAELRLQSQVTYDGRYLRIGYPMGDVPETMGVCTDVVIRSLRGLGVDLQQRVHEDMRRNFRSYPNHWQLSRPDSNIDHRRVPNLMTYFKRAGASLPITRNPWDYRAGEIVAWEMGNGMTHIGIVSTHKSEVTGNPLIVHNIGVGPELTDILFDFNIIGHYNYGGNPYGGNNYADNKSMKHNIDNSTIHNFGDNSEI